VLRIRPFQSAPLASFSKRSIRRKRIAARLHCTLYRLSRYHNLQYTEYFFCPYLSPHPIPIQQTMFFFSKITTILAWLLTTMFSLMMTISNVDAAVEIGTTTTTAAAAAATDGHEKNDIIHKQTLSKMDNNNNNNINIYTREEVINHNDIHKEEFWAIVDNYVLDLTDFLQYHPTGAQQIIQRRKKSIDISSNFLDHFDYTVQTFKKACEEFDRGSMGKPVVLKFPEVMGEVFITGKMDMVGRT
jgi:cytochrome b involved in lipid metabolism